MYTEELYRGLNSTQVLQLRKTEIVMEGCDIADIKNLVLQYQKQTLMLTEMYGRTLIGDMPNATNAMGSWAFGDSHLG